METLEMNASYIPCIKQRNFPNHLWDVIKISRKILLVSIYGKKYTLIRSKDFKQVKVIKDFENISLQYSQIVWKKYLVAYGKNKVLFFRIDEYNLVLLLKVEDPSKEFLNILELKSQRDKVGICWENRENQGHIDVYDLSPTRVQLKQTFIVEDKDIQVKYLIPLKHSNYYLYQKNEQKNNCSFKCIGKLKFKNRLIIKEVKCFEHSGGEDDFLLFKSCPNSDIALIYYRENSEFFDFKYRRFTKFQSSLGEDQCFVNNLQPLPSYNNKIYPYVLGYIGEQFQLHLMNYANGEIIYHLFDFDEQSGAYFLLFKASVPMIKCNYEGKPNSQLKMVTRKQAKALKEVEELKKIEDFEMYSDVTEGWIQVPKLQINHECDFTYGNYDIITIFNDSYISKFRLMIPDLEANLLL